MQHWRTPWARVSDTNLLAFRWHPKCCPSQGRVTQFRGQNREKCRCFYCAMLLFPLEFLLPIFQTHPNYENPPNNSLIGKCWENPWDWGPLILIINPIYTLCSGCLLGISPFKGLLGVVKQLGYRVPLSQGYHHFPYDKQPTNGHFRATKRCWVQQ